MREDRTTKVRVLFICLGNSCRSPMAEAIARATAGDLIEASSAGLAPLGHVMDMSKRTLLNNGYEVEGLASKAISPELWDAAEVVINMSGHPRERAFRSWEKVEDWDVEDPYGADAALYQRICEDIERRVGELAERLRKKTGRPSRRSGQTEAQRREEKKLDMG
jgi:arsenate reductase